MRRSPHVGTGHQRGPPCGDFHVRHPPHLAGPHPRGRRRRQSRLPDHQGVRQGRRHGARADAVQYAGVELGDPGRRRRKDRVVRAPRRLPGHPVERLRRQFPLRPDRHRATEPPWQRRRLARAVRAPARNSRRPPAEVQRAVRGTVPRAPADEGTGGQLPRRPLPTRASRRARVPDRYPLQRPRPGHGRHVADGGRQRGRVLRLDTRPAAVCRGGLRVL